MGKRPTESDIVNELIDDVQKAASKLREYCKYDHAESVNKVVFNCLAAFSTKEVKDAVANWIAYRKQRDDILEKMGL